jgi:uncharacterized membrane protein SirB2
VNEPVPAEHRDHLLEDVGDVATERRTHARYGLRSSLATIIPATAAPYGYTLAIWSCGAVLLRSHGTPSFADTLLFVAGAIVGFDVLGLLAIGVLGHARPIDRRQDRVVAGVLDWVALGAVVAAVVAISGIPGWAPWLLGPFTATVLYLVIASLQLALLSMRAERNPGDDPT